MNANRSVFWASSWATLWALWFAAAPVLGEETPPSAAEILKLHDRAHSNFQDLTIESKMTIREPGAETGRQVALTTWLKGEDKRLVRFTAPADMRGMGILTEGRDTMYAFLPGFQRVRRMGIHLKGQSFMGSDLTFEDMNESTLTGLYAPKYLGSEGEAWILELALLPGKQAEFPKLKVWIDKQIHQSTRVEYYDEKGQKARTATRSGWKKDEGPIVHYSPERMVMVDHRRNGHSTELVIVKAKVNQQLGDELFSQRSLIRGAN